MRFMKVEKKKLNSNKNKLINSKKKLFKPMQTQPKQNKLELLNIFF